MLTLLLYFSCATTTVLASPFLVKPSGVEDTDQATPTENPQRVTRRDLEGPALIPILVVCIAAVIAIVLAFFIRKSTGFRRTIARIRASINGTSTASGTRELTAEQLAGSINNNGARSDLNQGGNTNTAATTNNTSGANGAATTTTTRRTRRARRTPSQISTHSLPAYAKEPGEQELVVMQGSQDLEDAALQVQQPRTIVVLDEEDEGSSTQGHGQRYSPIPETPHDTPLLFDHDQEQETDNNAFDHPPSRPVIASAEGSQDPLINPPREHGHMRNASRNTDDSADTLAREVDESNARGPAPGYFEVTESPSDANSSNVNVPHGINVGGGVLQRGYINAGPHNTPPTHHRADSGESAILTAEGTVDTISPPGSPEPANTSPNVPTTPPRRSGFRSFLDRVSMAGGASMHGRTDSGSGASSISHHRSRSPTVTHHRGGSTASTSLSLFRNISHQRPINTPSSSHHNLYNLNGSTTNLSRANLTSPSLISLTSISAPLTHTAVRTEFRTGGGMPTPEQVKWIASRESLVRFGLPYGPDAVRFAASSRVSLGLGATAAGGAEEVPPVPPPEFDDIVGRERTSGANEDANESAHAGAERRMRDGMGEENETDSPVSLPETSIEGGNEEGEGVLSRSTSTDEPVSHVEVIIIDVGKDDFGDMDKEKDGEITEEEDKEAEVESTVDGSVSEDLTQEEKPAETSGVDEEARSEKINLPDREIAASEKAELESDGVTELVIVENKQPPSLSVPGLPADSGSIRDSPPGKFDSLIATEPISSPADPSISTSAPLSSSHSTESSILEAEAPATSRSDSRASSGSASSTTSYQSYGSDDSRGSRKTVETYKSAATFKTANESMISRRHINGSVSEFGEFRSDEEDVNEEWDDEEDERPSTPTQHESVGSRGGHAREETDKTVMVPGEVSQETPRKEMRETKHMSTATITLATDV